MLGDLFDAVGSIVGTTVGIATGVVLGVSIPVIAATLQITEAMVTSALDAGCTTYEEIRSFHDLK